MSPSQASETCASASSATSARKLTIRTAVRNCQTRTCGTHASGMQCESVYQAGRAYASTPETSAPPRVQGSIVAIEAAVSTRAPLTALDSFLPVAPRRRSPVSVTIYSAVSSLPTKDFVVAINIPVTVAIDSSVSRPRIEDFIITIRRWRRLRKISASDCCPT